MYPSLSSSSHGDPDCWGSTSLQMETVAVRCWFAALLILRISFSPLSLGSKYPGSQERPSRSRSQEPTTCRSAGRWFVLFAPSSFFSSSDVTNQRPAAVSACHSFYNTFQHLLLLCGCAEAKPLPSFVSGRLLRWDAQKYSHLLQNLFIQKYIYSITCRKCFNALFLCIFSYIRLFFFYTFPTFLSKVPLIKTCFLFHINAVWNNTLLIRFYWYFCIILRASAAERPNRGR